LLSPSVSFGEISNLPISFVENIIREIPKLEKKLHRLSSGQMLVDILLAVFSKDGKRGRKEEIDFTELKKAPMDKKKSALEKLISNYKNIDTTSALEKLRKGTTSIKKDIDSKVEDSNKSSTKGDTN